MPNTNFDDLISSCPDCCESKTTASENGKRFEIISKEKFTRLKIDDCIIKSKETKKCDFGFVSHSNNDFYFVELKGKNIEKAYDQIVTTINFF